MITRIKVMASSAPSNASELQLYRVLQRANLLQYYDTFINQGGDDVQQLCEAGEEEFLEIMALVGMASKPLHVRRLQKALQEWVINPALFQQPLTSGSVATVPAPGSITASVQQTPPSADRSFGLLGNHTINAAAWDPTAADQSQTNPSPTLSISSLSKDEETDAKFKLVPIYKLNMGDTKLELHGHSYDPLRISTSPIPTPVLVDHQIQALAEAAERLYTTLPHFEVKPMNMKKQINKEIEEVINILPEDVEKLDKIRKFSAIYGRFDSKRKYDKPMTLHEISVNEAAAQLCSHIPALLTRREELFPLARQVVRDSGYQYSKGHSSRATMVGDNILKKPKLEGGVAKAEDMMSIKPDDKDPIEERIDEINKELHIISEKQQVIKDAIQVAKEEEKYTLIHEYQANLEALTREQLVHLTERNDLLKKQRKGQSRVRPTDRVMTNNTDSTSALVIDGSVSESQCSENTDHSGMQPKNSTQTSNEFVQNSLFDEGLRIAQQYGMAEFAEELIGMKPKNSDSEEDVDDDDSGANNADDRPTINGNTYYEDSGTPCNTNMTQKTCDDVNNPSIGGSHSENGLDLVTDHDLVQSKTDDHDSLQEMLNSVHDTTLPVPEVEFCT